MKAHFETYIFVIKPVIQYFVSNNVIAILGFFFTTTRYYLTTAVNRNAAVENERGGFYIEDSRADRERIVIHNDASYHAHV